MGWNPIKDIGHTVHKAVHEVEHIGHQIEHEAERDIHHVGKFIEDNRGLLTAVPLFFVPVIGPELAVADLGIGIADPDITNEMFDVVTGKYADDQKRLQEESDRYNNLAKQYNDELANMASEYVIDDEIFQIEAKNKFRAKEDEYYGTLDQMKAQFDADLKKFNEKYKFVQKLLNNKYAKYIMIGPLIIGGIVSDAKAAFVHGDWKAAKHLLTIGLEVLGIVIAVLLAIPSGGQSLWVAIPLWTAVITQTINLVITLDSLYAQGLLMHLVFSMLDIVLNDVLHLDKIAPKLDTYKLSDAKYYNELTGYVRMLNTVVGLVAGLTALYTMPEGYASTALEGTVFGSEGAIGAVTSSSTYKELYTAYIVSSTTKDIINQQKAYEALKEKLQKDTDKLFKRIRDLRTRKIMKSYKEEKDMLTDTSDIISNYVMSGFSTPTSTFDPEMTIAANFGYEYKGNNIMDFMDKLTIDFNSLAGGKKYTSDILYSM